MRPANSTTVASISSESAVPQDWLRVADILQRDLAAFFIVV